MATESSDIRSELERLRHEFDDLRQEIRHLAGGPDAQNAARRCL